MVRIIALLLLFGISTLPVAAMAAEGSPTVAIGLPQAPPALPILRMIDSGVLKDRVDLKITIWTGPEQLIAMVQGGNHHLFVLPLAVAAKLHNKGIGIALTNVSMWGAPYLVTADPALRDWSGLRGKKLFAPPRSSTPSVLTEYFLAQAGLKPGEDAEIISLAAAEIGQLLKAGRIEYAVVLEPHLTIALNGNSRLRIAIDFAEEWQKATGAAGLPSAGLGGASAWLEANRELVHVFENEYEKAVDWILEHPREAGELAEKHLGIRASVIAASLPRLGLRYVTAPDAAEDVNRLYRTLYEYSPELIGKKIPDATLYWK